MTRQRESGAKAGSQKRKPVPRPQLPPIPPLPPPTLQNTPQPDNASVSSKPVMNAFASDMMVRGCEARLPARLGWIETSAGGKCRRVMIGPEL